MKRKHGTVAKYVKEKCRCKKCKEANRIYQKGWRAEHPGYHADWSRNHRETLLVRANKSEKKRVKRLRQKAIINVSTSAIGIFRPKRTKVRMEKVP